MSRLTLLGAGGPIATNPYGRPSTNWISWTEAGADSTQTEGESDSTLEDPVSGSNWVSSGANRPIWRASAINGRPGWEFNGDASNSTGSFATRPGTGYQGELTVVFALRFADASGIRQIESGNNSAKSKLFTNGLQLRSFSGETNTALNWGFSVTSNTNYIIAIRFKSGEGSKLWVNGSATGSVIATHTSFRVAASGTNNFLGRDYVTTGNGFAGFLGAIGFAYSALDDSIIEADSLTLKSRYGI